MHWYQQWAVELTRTCATPNGSSSTADAAPGHIITKRNIHIPTQIDCVQGCATANWRVRYGGCFGTRARYDS
eukprot:22113-Eustigmatos_ZCMA.PRE.1